MIDIIRNKDRSKTWTIAHITIKVLDGRKLGGKEGHEDKKIDL